MPIPSAEATISETDSNGKTYLLPFILVTSLFFLWGIANSLNGTLTSISNGLTLNRAQRNCGSAFYIGYL